jgi:hypothetical protein
MYQNTLNLTRRLAAVGLFARSVFSGHPNLSWIIPLKTEFGRVVQHKQILSLIVARHTPS